MKLKTKILILALILISFFVYTYFSSADIVEQYTAQDGNDQTNIDTGKILGQTFNVTTGTQTIKNVSIKMYRQGTISSVFFRIRAINVSGLPNSTIISTGSLVASTITTIANGQFYNSTMQDNGILENNKQYFLEVNFSQEPATNIFVRTNTSNPYSKGEFFYSEDSGQSWIIYPGIDMLFIIESNGSTQERVTTTLNQPENNDILVQKNILFNASVQVQNGVYRNSTIYLYNSSNNLLNNSNISNLNPSNESIFQINNLSNGVYTWNILSCTTNSICSFQNSNFTFEIGTEILGETYNNVTYEGMFEKFIINISVPNTETLSNARLFYNQTLYSGSISNIVGNNFSISVSFNVPTLNSDTTKNFFWILDFMSGNQLNTTTRNQTIKSISFDSCSSLTEVILNYTLLDEDQKHIINSTSNTSIIEIDLDLFALNNNSAVSSFNASYINVSFAPVCINQGILNQSTYRLDSVVKYVSSNRVTEYNYIQNYTLNNNTIPNNVNLYDLAQTTSQEFLITYKNKNLIPISNVLIFVERYYVSNSEYKIVEVAKTDIDGNALVHLVLSDVVYTISVKSFDRTLATFNNVQAFCSNLQTGDCTILLKEEDSSTSIYNFNTLDNLNYVIINNRTTRNITLIYNSIDGSSLNIIMNGSIFDNYLNNTICSKQSISSSGTLTCNFPSVSGNNTILIKVYKDYKLIFYSYYKFSDSPLQIYGNNRVLYFIILYMTLTLLFIGSPIFMIIAGILSFVLAGFLLLIEDMGIFGSSSIILWFIIAGSIIIWRIQQKNG